MQNKDKTNELQQLWEQEMQKHKTKSVPPKKGTKIAIPPPVVPDIDIIQPE
jgi:hypothetical protein